jgi:hypothetical protein
MLDQNAPAHQVDAIATTDITSLSDIPDPMLSEYSTLAPRQSEVSEKETAMSRHAPHYLPMPALPTPRQ